MLKNFFPHVLCELCVPDASLPQQRRFGGRARERKDWPHLVLLQQLKCLQVDLLVLVFTRHSLMIGSRGNVLATIKEALGRGAGIHSTAVYTIQSYLHRLARTTLVVEVASPIYEQPVHVPALSILAHHVPQHLFSNVVRLMLRLKINVAYHNRKNEDGR